MKTYFENDPDKQEMLEYLVDAYNGIVVKRELKHVIERNTKESIEEVLG